MFKTGFKFTSNRMETKAAVEVVLRGLLMPYFEIRSRIMLFTAEDYYRVWYQKDTEESTPPLKNTSPMLR